LIRANRFFAAPIETLSMGSRSIRGEGVKLQETRETAESERRWYLGALLHALNQPLTAIASCVEAASGCLNDGSDPFLHGALDGARGETARAILVARELRAALGGGERREPGAIDVNRVLADVAPSLSSEVGVPVRLELDEDTGRGIGDTYALRRVMIALAKSDGLAPASGDVTVVLRSRSEPGGPAIELELTTNGAPRTPASGTPASPAIGAVSMPPMDPFSALARSVLTDFGGELILVTSEPYRLRYLIRLALA
jgi:hypothetical protein